MDAFYAVRGAARRPGAARPAGDRGRHGGVASLRPRATRSASSACIRRADARGAAPLSYRAGLRASAHLSLLGGITAPIFRRVPRVSPPAGPGTLSLDEAFLDVTGSVCRSRPAEQIAREIKRLIHDRTEAHRVRRCRTEQARGQDRIRPAQAGWARRGAPR